MKHLCKKHNLNKLFWEIIYLMPLITYSITLINNSNAELMAGYGILTNNVIYNTIIQIFGTGGYLELFASDSKIILFITYFVAMEIIHIITDILVFLPRIAQTFCDKINNSGDNEE